MDESKVRLWSKRFGKSKIVLRLPDIGILEYWWWCERRLRDVMMGRMGGHAEVGHAKTMLG